MKSWLAVLVIALAAGCGSPPDTSKAELEKVKAQPKAVEVRTKSQAEIDADMRKAEQFAAERKAIEERSRYAAWLRAQEAIRGKMPEVDRKGVALVVMDALRKDPYHRGSVKVVEWTGIEPVDNDCWGQRVRYDYVNLDWRDDQNNDVFVIKKGFISEQCAFSKWPKRRRTTTVISTYHRGPAFAGPE